MSTEFIQSPLNYTGNKFRLLPELMSLFPSNCTNMMDLFCGGGTVGINSKAQKVIFVDANKRVISLLDFLSKQDFNTLLENMEKIINEYHLSNSYKNGYSVYKQMPEYDGNNALKKINSTGYYALRDYYNSLDDKDSDSANTILYVLMLYGFNNDIRFNSDGKFNLPVGKTDLNSKNVKKVQNFINKMKDVKCDFLFLDFEDERINDIVKAVDFIYMDPPYLIGNAFYNTMWNTEKEYKLLSFIDSLIGNRKNFALSNVISKKGIINEPLTEWCDNNKDKIKINELTYNYRSASYNKRFRDAEEKEVLITNKEYF